MTPNKEVSGIVNGIRYSIDETLIIQMKEEHNIDAIKEIEDALRNMNTYKGDNDAS